MKNNAQHRKKKPIKLTLFCLVFLSVEHSIYFLLKSQRIGCIDGKQAVIYAPKKFDYSKPAVEMEFHKHTENKALLIFVKQIKHSPTSRTYTSNKTNGMAIVHVEFRRADTQWALLICLRKSATRFWNKINWKWKKNYKKKNKLYWRDGFIEFMWACRKCCGATTMMENV